MNKKVIVLRSILEDQAITQRRLAERAGLSLGSVNTILRGLIDEGYIRDEGRARGRVLTAQGREYLDKYRVDGAVILAAGFGTRFVPLSFEMPKGLIEVYGEPMIEREIRQLKEAGISDITVVVGYMKERFEYLIDRCDVRLIYNPDYETHNNISSVYAARDFIRDKNVYLLSSDHYMRDNIFNLYEPDSWYAARHFEGDTPEWALTTDRNGRIRSIRPGGRDENCMYGPAYLSRSFTGSFIDTLTLIKSLPGTEDYFWENVLMDMLSGRAEKLIREYGLRGRVPDPGSVDIYMRLLPDSAVYEFECLEDLRAFDPRYRDDSGSKAMRLVSEVFRVKESEISGIRRLKAGMTNQSWLFTLRGVRYISRVPGAGTGMLINRHEEKAVYDAVKGLGITEDVIYFDEETGFKISRYLEGSRTADPDSPSDMARCMEALRRLHLSGVSVGHSFDIGEKIRLYEGLIGESEIPFRDYARIKSDKEALIGRLRLLDAPRVLAHIDAVSDNFLLTGDEVRLIDWEYAGMSDPLIDPAMCAIYSYRDEEGALMLLREYLKREPGSGETARLYSYMALGGLLWSLWGVYKEKLGVRFTDYTIKMMRYFKEYSRKAADIYGKI